MSNAQNNNIFLSVDSLKTKGFSNKSRTLSFILRIIVQEWSREAESTVHDAYFIPFKSSHADAGINHVHAPKQCLVHTLDILL